MSPLRSFYDHPLYKNPIFPYGVAHNPCPEGSGRAVTLKNIISRRYHCNEQNGYLKICTGHVWEDDGRGGGDWILSVHFRLLKRVLALLISNLMSAFRILMTIPYIRSALVLN